MTDPYEYCQECHYVHEFCKCKKDVVNDPDTDVVNKPEHYQNKLGVEVIELIDEYFPDNYNLGNVLKYLLRADKKGARQQDLEKAHVYLGREIERGR